jgi:hypothetical protein
MPIRGAWSNPALRRCDRKCVYRSFARAEIAAEKASHKTGELILAYQCYDCSAFHIGHADESQKIVRRPPDPPSLPVTCPRCKGPIPEHRRLAASQTGSSTVYCSRKCQQKWSRKLRHLRKYADPSKLK